jgi:UDP-N-acetylglucosamine 4,6-dehydratase
VTDYLIIGGTGSLGQKLIEELLPEHTVAVYSRDEAKHWTIRNGLACGPLASRLSALSFYVGDVRDRGRIREVLRQTQPRTVIVASALKQVDTCEMSPGESVQTNLDGVANAIEEVNINGKVERLLLVSTDKACAPVNVYGMCKAIAERLVTSQVIGGLSHVKYLAVRYGNVLESRGSIIPLFRHQADHADALTVTDPDMTRFVMTLSQSVQLIKDALEYGKSGETWIPRLPAMRIGDLAELFSERSGKPIRVIGLRPGEKMHEDLINESESVRAATRSLFRRVGSHDVKAGEVFVINHASASATGKSFTYSSSDTVMSKAEMTDVLSRVINLPMEKFVGRSIEEIRRD